MIKNLLAFIGAVVIVAVIGLYASFGSKVSALDSKAMPAFMAMFDNILTNGDPARAMMKTWKVEEGISGDEVKESIEALTEEYNMRLTGYVKMYTKEDAGPDEVKEARIFSLCNLTTAKVFLNYSQWYGGFMPCRIMYIQYGNGDANLISMDMTLAIHGGKPLPKEMLEAALKVKEAMEKVPERAAKGDF
ncbi:DUF302 domain-containing protein [Sulfurimonas microaerophilic]|uniref:DUF302 domain-containing protein n=1 Tax=Sulfurimonas microaerophilic TaxID=3058392 RepID=UPI0027153B75|nr:DUF302 domain-containing protein [Sulfurimonas sp. hsl 1-7]